MSKELFVWVPIYLSWYRYGSVCLWALESFTDIGANALSHSSDVQNWHYKINFAINILEGSGSVLEWVGLQFSIIAKMKFQEIKHFLTCASITTFERLQRKKPTFKTFYLKTLTSQTGNKASYIN